VPAIQAANSASPRRLATTSASASAISGANLKPWPENPVRIQAPPRRSAMKRSPSATL
jgi:hypothetical protein